MNAEQVKMQIEESKGELILVSARPSNGGKYNVEFAQKLRTETNVLGILNAADSRFNTGGRARRAWMSVEPENFKQQFGIDLETAPTEEDAYGRETVYLGLSNPTITNPDTGEVIDLAMQVTESTILSQVHKSASSQAWALKEPHRSIKQDGQGNWLYLDNMPIYSNAEIVPATTVNHTYVTHNGTQPVQEPVSVTEEEPATDVLATVE